MYITPCIYSKACILAYIKFLLLGLFCCNNSANKYNLTSILVTVTGGVVTIQIERMIFGQWFQLFLVNIVRHEVTQEDMQGSRNMYHFWSHSNEVKFQSNNHLVLWQIIWVISKGGVLTVHSNGFVRLIFIKDFWVLL